MRPDPVRAEYGIRASRRLLPMQAAGANGGCSPIGLDLRSGFMAAAMSLLLLQIGNRPG